jgi:hypothetical protein
MAAHGNRMHAAATGGRGRPAERPDPARSHAPHADRAGSRRIAPIASLGSYIAAAALAVRAGLKKMLVMPLLDGLQVVSSRIHGYGVIATRPFRTDEVICYGDGVLYAGDAEFDDTYALVLPAEDSGQDEQLFWDLVCQTRWFNHSCDPNTEVMLKWDRETRTMTAWWVALRDIPVGEEITYDYGFVADVAEPCLCGAASCRGVIVDDDPANLARLPDHLRALLRGPARAAS